MNQQQYAPGYQQPGMRPQPQPHQQYMPQQPVQQPEIMTGGAKAGYCLAAVFLGWISLVILYFSSKDKGDAYVREGDKWVMIGMIINIVLAFILVMTVFSVLIAAVASVAAIG